MLDRATDNQGIIASIQDRLNVLLSNSSSPAGVGSFRIGNTTLPQNSTIRFLEGVRSLINSESPLVTAQNGQAGSSSLRGSLLSALNAIGSGSPYLDSVSTTLNALQQRASSGYTGQRRTKGQKTTPLTLPPLPAPATLPRHPRCCQRPGCNAECRHQRCHPRPERQNLLG